MIGLNNWIEKDVVNLIWINRIEVYVYIEILVQMHSFVNLYRELLENRCPVWYPAPREAFFLWLRVTWRPVWLLCPHPHKQRVPAVLSDLGWYIGFIALAILSSGFLAELYPQNRITNMGFWLKPNSSPHSPLLPNAWALTAQIARRGLLLHETIV